MSAHQDVIERYIEGFRRGDHAQVLSCLADDIVWDLPGAYHLVGKEAFDKEIENPAFIGPPTIVVTRMTEENDVVAAEGTVSCARRDGEMLNAALPRTARWPCSTQTTSSARQASTCAWSPRRNPSM